MMKIYKDINDPEIVDRLQSGQVGVLPSDTVYGLMCIANRPVSVHRLYELKQRENKPGTLIGASINQFAQLGLNSDELATAKTYWPGPVSVVLDANTALSYLHLGHNSLAVRIPDDPNLLKLLEQTGVLQTTSANITNQPVANTITEAQEYFGDKVDFYVDGGDLSNHEATTVIRINDGVIQVLRQGAQQVVS